MVSNTLLDASLSYAPTIFSYANFFTVYLEKTLINEIWPTRAHATLYAADNNGVILAQFSRHYWCISCRRDVTESQCTWLHIYLSY